LNDQHLRNWRLSVVLGVPVLGVVGLLVAALARTVDRILDGTGVIWRVGKSIANNTIHIPLLIRTNQTVARISSTADRIAAETARLRRVVNDGTVE
jgi:hypothetical protein